MRAMLRTLPVAFLSLLVLLGACKKREPANPPTAAADVKPKRPIPPPPPPPLSAEEAKQLLSEENVKRFMTYHREMVATRIAAGNPGATEAATTAPAAPPASAGKGETAKPASRPLAALEKSGLTPAEAAKLGRLLMPYYARIAGMKIMMERSQQARGMSGEGAPRGASGSTDPAPAARPAFDHAARVEAIRKDFADRYGADALLLLQKHEPEFLTIQEQMTSAGMGPGGPRRGPLGPAGPGPSFPPPRPTAPPPPSPQR